MIIRSLCLLLGRLLMLLLAAYELLQQLCLRLHALACRSYDYWQCDQRALLGRARHELQKLPKHLVLIIAPDDGYVDAALLQCIFGYAQIVGIPNVSVYDTRTPRNGHVQLGRFCQCSDTGTDRGYLWPPKPPKEQRKLHPNGSCNGKANGSTTVNATSDDQLQIYQIRRSDGHELIGDVCRELYENRTTPQVQEMLRQRQALTDGINERLNKRLGIAVPEPELGIIFARQTCTYGLLPWHIRFTEFHTHRSGRYFGAESFAKVLYKYARCEQRWGK